MNYMGKLTKIYVGYELMNLPAFVKPNDTLKGKIIVINNGEKELKLEEIFIELIESYDKDYGEGPSPLKNILETYYFRTRGMIEPMKRKNILL